MAKTLSALSSLSHERLFPEIIIIIRTYDVDALIAFVRATAYEEVLRFHIPVDEMLRVAQTLSYVTENTRTGSVRSAGGGGGGGA